MNRIKVLKNQELIWSLANLSTCKETFNISCSYLFHGYILAEQLKSAVDKVVSRHSALLLEFTYQDGKVWEHLHKGDTGFNFKSESFDIDFSEPHGNPLLTQDINVPFNLSDSNLFSVKLYTFKNNKSVVNFNFHSILIDKKHAYDLVKEIADEYSFSASKAIPLSHINDDYFKIVQSLNLYEETDEFKSNMKEWLTCFPNSNEKLNLPTDYTERHSFDFSGKSIIVDLGINIIEGSDVEIKNNFDKELFYNAAYAILLHRLSNQDEIIIGVSKLLDIQKGVIGNFENILPVKVDFSSSPNLFEVIEQLKDNLIYKKGFSNVPYPALVENSATKKDITLNQYYQTSFSFIEKDNIQFGKLQAEELYIDKNGSRFDLTFDIFEYNKATNLRVEFNTNKFSDKTIQRWIEIYKNIVAQILKNPTCPTDEIEIINRTDLSILNSLNDTDTKFEDSVCIHHKLEKWAESVPDSIALYWDEEKISYRELNEQANKLASFLVSQFDTKDKIIAISMDRCPDMMVSIYAILKCGATYLPIDPHAPVERTKAILGDAKPIAILTKDRNSQDFVGNNIKLLNLDDLKNDLIELSAQNLDLKFSSETNAYIIYTSGSTGIPKGVIIKHQSVLNRIGWMHKSYPIDNRDVLIQKTPTTFDVSVWELFWWSFGGAGLVLLAPGFEKEPAKLIGAIKKYGVTTIHFVPSMFNAFITYLDAFKQQDNLASLKHIFLSGEALPADTVNQFYNLIKEKSDTKLINLYGPTEATVDVSYYECKSNVNHSKIFIGKPIDNTQLWIVNRKNKIQPIGVQGELIIGGVNLAVGYLNRSELTKEKFIYTSINGLSTRVYKTGDIASWDQIGEIEYLGRMDNQVKIRGFRIELGEIEARIAEYPNVESCAVIVNKENPDNPILEAYFKPTTSADEVKKNDMVNFLADKLPSYMIPTQFKSVSEMPMTSSGKLDRKALSSISQKQVENKLIDENDIEGILLNIWSEVLRKQNIENTDNFFDIGGNSIMIPHIQSKLLKEYQITVDTVDIFQYPTIGSLSSFLNKKLGRVESNIKDTDQIRSKLPSNKSSDDHKIAIVGMAGKFPEADTIEEFWKNLIDNKESLQFFTDEQLKENDVTFEQNKDNPNYIRSRGVLRNIKDWDAKFFGYSPNDARHTDPQQRLWFETVWNALEDAGIDPFRHDGDIGVFAGVNLNSYLFDNILRNRALYEDYMHFSNAETFHTYVNNDAAFIATRTAYLFNLRGPAINVQTACSTSLTAVAQACSSLVSGDSDVAIAGAASVQTPQEIGYVFQTGSMRSADGHCRPFDKDASGTVFSNAVGAVVLKRLDDAIKDNDEIYGVIRGWALNNDGNDKIGFAAPSVNGQLELLRKAQRHANINPEEIGYIEAHGTGTIMGDPIEASALIQAFRENTSKNQFCGLGSAKGNFGHTDEVAGMIGLIKSALATRHKLIPATINYSSPNPNIDFKNSPFFVTDKNLEWPNEKPLIIGVSSFGVGGTNAHVILEDYQNNLSDSGELDTDKPQLITVSGKTDKSLQENIQNTINYLQNSTDNISDIAYTTQMRRSHFQKRAFVTISKGKNIDVGDFKLGSQTHQTKKKIFLFPGQGSQFVNMGKDLYEKVPLFREWLDKGFEIYHNETGGDLKSLMFADILDEDSKLHHTEYTQPSLFIVSFAMAKLYESFGITPDESIGHSIGEYAAACLAGVFDFESALKIVIKRGKLMQSVPNGGMMAVRTNAETLMNIKSKYFEIAALNAPMSCTICFKNANLKKVSKVLEKNEIEYILLNTSHAFHSSDFDIILDEFEGYVNTFSLQNPKSKFISCSTGDYANDEEVRTGKYWANQLRKTVRFNEGINKILSKKEGVFIEVGPNTHLSSLTRQNENVNMKTKIIYSIGRLPAGNTYETFIASLGEMWLTGILPDFKQFHERRSCKFVRLPHYAFDKARYWIEIDHKKLSNIIDTPFDMNDVIIKSEETATVSTDVKIKSKELTLTQKQLIEIWNKALGTTDIDIEDSFFVVGGHSLLAVSLVDSIQKEFGVKIVLKDFFENPTILHLENLIKSDRPDIETKAKEKKGLFQKIRSSTNKKLIKGEI